MAKRTLFCIIAAICAIALFAGLWFAEKTSPCLAADDSGTCVVTNIPESETYLLEGWQATSQGLQIQLDLTRAPSPLYVYLSANAGALLSIDSVKVPELVANNGEIYSLPPEHGLHTLTLNIDSGHLTASDISVFIGSISALIEQSNSSALLRLFIIGVNFAALFYSISLWLRKRSEHYLLAFAGYAAFALLHVARRASLIVAQSPLIAALFSFNIFQAATPGGNAAFSTMWILFLEFALRYLVLRTFVPTRLLSSKHTNSSGKSNRFIVSLKELDYIWIGLAGFIVCSFIAIVTRNESLPTIVSTIYRVGFPCLEAFVIIKGYLHSGSREQAGLVLAWLFMLPVLIFNWACELLIIDTYSLGSRIGLGGIAETLLVLGLLFAISVRFAEKFAEAEVLSKALSRMNAGLEQTVDKKTAELRQTNENLMRAQRQKDELTSNVAHNIKTPLFTITGYSDMAASCMQSDPGLALEYLDVIKNNANKAQANVRNLLLATRLEDKLLEFNPVRININQVVNQVVQNLQASAQALHVTLEMPQNMPNEAYCFVDGSFVSQALENVITNALESCAEEGVVQVALAIHHNSAYITVRDNGCGIAPEDLPHIFDRYWSNKNQKRNGTGLGLSIAKDIIEQSNGTICVLETTQHGTVFEIMLPLDSITEDTLDYTTTENQE